MIDPIQFTSQKGINLGLLKSQLDRRVDKITLMIQGMSRIKPPNQLNKQKQCSQMCCQLVNEFSQTQEEDYTLTDISSYIQNQVSMSDRCIEDRKKRISRQKFKQNKGNVDGYLMRDKSKSKMKVSHLIAIHETPVEDSFKKNNQGCSYMIENYQQTEDDSQQVMSSLNQLAKQGGRDSFQSCKLKNSADRSCYEHFSRGSRADSSDFNFSINLPETMELKATRTKKRKNSVTELSICRERNERRITQFANLSANNIQAEQKIYVNHDVRQKVYEQFQKRLENRKGREPRVNNIRISLLKRLEQKFFKTK